LNQYANHDGPARAPPTFRSLQMLGRPSILCIIITPPGICYVQKHIASETLINH
jgi:hypothetical protein